MKSKEEKKALQLSQARSSVVYQKIKQELTKALVNVDINTLSDLVQALKKLDALALKALLDGITGHKSKRVEWFREYKDLRFKIPLEFLQRERTVQAIDRMTRAQLEAVMQARTVEDMQAIIIDSGVEGLDQGEATDDTANQSQEEGGGIKDGGGSESNKESRSTTGVEENTHPHRQE